MIANAVLEHRRQEQLKMAQYIADGVEVEPIARGADGGMNPVFADSGKLQNGKIDENGRVYTVASLSSAPAAAQATDNAAKTARVPLPARSPLARPAPKQKSTIASLIDGLFSGGSSSANAAPAATESAPAATQTELAAKPKKRSRKKRTASAPVRLRRSVSANDKPKAVARTAPKPVKQTAKKQMSAEPKTVDKAEKKTAAARPETKEAKPAVQSAFTSPPATTGNGVLPGAQPVVRSGSFDARWSALR
jgi:hypothetical protein